MSEKVPTGAVDVAKRSDLIARFEPDGRHWGYVEALLTANTEHEPTVPELAKKCGVPERTIYNWRGDPAFRAWVLDVTDGQIESRLPRMLVRLATLAETGDAESLKFLLKHYLPRFMDPRRLVNPVDSGTDRGAVPEGAVLELLCARLHIPKHVAALALAGKVVLAPVTEAPEDLPDLNENGG